MLVHEQVPREDREFDIIIYGPGYTGMLTMEYMARQTSTPDRSRIKWAIAGRSREKLEAAREWLGASVSISFSQVPIVVADVADEEALVSMASRTRCLITTVGPYFKLGPPVIGACITANTDYVDMTGEWTFIKQNIDRYGDLAREQGTLVLSGSAWAGLLADVGTWYTERLLVTRAGDSILDEIGAMEGYQRLMGPPPYLSSGTLRTLITSFETHDAEAAARKKSGKPKPKPAKKPSGQGNRGYKSKGGLHWVKGRGPVVPFAEGADKQISGMTIAANHPPERRYRYTPYFQADSMRQAFSLGWTFFKVIKLRKCCPMNLSKYQNPTAETRAKQAFEVDFICKDRKGRELAATRITGPDPGYYSTAVIAAEVAFAVVMHRASLPVQGGVVSPAHALGSFIVDGIQHSGEIKIATLRMNV